MSNSANVNNKQRTLYRESVCWDMRIKQNKPQHEIAAFLGISQVAVCKILKRITANFYEMHYEDVALVKQEQVLQLERTATEAWDAWEKSKAQGRVMRQKEYDGKESKEIELRDSNGDPQFLALYLKAKADIRAILGIDAETKTSTKITINGEYEATIDRVLGGLPPAIAAAASQGNTVSDIKG